MSRWTSTPAAAVGLAALAAVLYAPQLGHPFVTDDAVYIAENPAVTRGARGGAAAAGGRAVRPPARQPVRHRRRRLHRRDPRRHPRRPALRVLPRPLHDLLEPGLPLAGLPPAAHARLPRPRRHVRRPS